jgi:hypothetical protein
MSTTLPMPRRRLYLIKEVAVMLGCSVERCRELVAAGQLRPVRLSRQGYLRFDIHDIEALISGHKAPDERPE